jgi:exopolyphosphatase/guanosine-5'-triphosphate,3'-diphosphate pyrophosphatase
VFLTVLLRLAVRIHRGRDLESPDILLVIENQTHIHLNFNDGWLSAHPLSQLDLDIEAKRLESAGFKLTYA